MTTHYPSTPMDTTAKQRTTKQQMKLGVRINIAAALFLILLGTGVLVDMPMPDQYLFWGAVGIGNIIGGIHQVYVAWKWMEIHSTLGDDCRFHQQQIPTIGNPVYIKQLLRTNPSVRYMSCAADIRDIAEKIDHIVSRAKGIALSEVVPIPKNFDLLKEPTADMEDMLYVYLDRIAFTARLDLTTIRRNDDTNNYYCLTLHDVSLSLLFWVEENGGKLYYFMNCVDADGRTDLSIQIRDAVASVV